MKVCSKCWTKRPLEDFCRDASRADGLSYVCKECHSERGRLYYRGHENERESARIEYNYGISPDELNEMIMAQDNQCATCHCSITLERKHVNRAHIDHNHRTGKVRGLLCRECNLTLGNVKDNQETLINMIQYLKEYPE